MQVLDRYPGSRPDVRSAMALRPVVGLMAALVMAACQISGSPTSCNVQIEWIDFVQVGSTQYVAGPQSPTVIQESDLGPVFAHVRFKVSGNVCDPNYKLKDGDAAFLEPGTAIYEVRGHPPTEVLAARRNGQILRYAAMSPTD
jgi:hypothetical protein